MRGSRDCESVTASSRVESRKAESVPWYSFVPDLVMVLTTAPPARPNSASKFEVCTETSCTASGFVIWKPWPATEMSLFSVPSIRKLFERPREPLTEKVPTPKP